MLGPDLMATDLSGIDQKLGRAEEHLKAFGVLEERWERQQQARTSSSDPSQSRILETN
jgi:hypothetical protein